MRRLAHDGVLVVGAGLAGLSAAVRLAGPTSHGASAPSLGVLTKGVLSQSATRWAQGGVAAVLGGDEDSTDLRLADTLFTAGDPAGGLRQLDRVAGLPDTSLAPTARFRAAVWIAGQAMTTDYPSSFDEHSMIKVFARANHALARAHRSKAAESLDAQG